MKRKITFLSVVAGVLYVWMLIFPIYDDWESHKMSFLRGYGVEGYENKEGLVKDSLFDVYSVRVAPKERVFLFPEEVQAYRGETIDSRFSRIEIVLPDRFIQKTEVNLMETVQGGVLFIVVVFFVLLPLRFFKLISSLQDGNFFNRRNVRFIRQIGWLLLGVFVCDFLFNYLSWKINLTLFDFENYDIVQFASDPLLLVIGVVALLLAEVFARGVLLEEEQELTI